MDTPQYSGTLIDDLTATVDRVAKLVDALQRIELGCSFPSDDVQKCIRDVARNALQAAGAPLKGHAVIANRQTPDLSSMSNEELQGYYIGQSGTTRHASDCATSCAPAERPGPCDCKERVEKAVQQ